MALAKGWAAVRAIVAQLALVAALATPGQALMAQRLVRIGESIVRRLLIARALMSPLPQVKALTRKAREAFAASARRKRLDPRDVRYKPPVVRLRLFRLAEALQGLGDDTRTPRSRPLPPAVRVAQYGNLIVRTWSTHGDPGLPPISIEGAPVPKAEAPAPDRSALVRRINALQDAAARPHDHARRMARWVARQRLRRHGRHGPLRPGRAPGQVMDRRRRSLEQEQLADADYLARRALSFRAPACRDGPSRAPPAPTAQTTA